MARSSKSKARRKTSAWYQRHVHDAHVRRARQEGKRSRAAFKLTEILDRHGLKLATDMVVVDLGCAPGSWSEELARRIGSRGIIVGIDLLEVRPIDGVRVIQGDFTDEAVQREIESCLDGRKVDLVVSDMAPEMSGNKVIDQARMMALNEATLDFAVHHLREGGNLLLKSFQGEGFDVFRGELMQRFARVRLVKPAASRKTSAEMFLLALDFLPMASECGA